MKEWDMDLFYNTFINRARSRKVNQVWCNSRISAVDFYKKNKFKVGKIFNIVKIGKHLKMIKTIHEEKKSNYCFRWKVTNLL